MVEALLVAGTLALTPPVLVLLVQRDFWTRMHMPGMMHGLLLLLLATVLAGDGEVRGKAALIAMFLLITAPISNHAMAQTRHVRDRRREGRGEQRHRYQAP